VSGSGAGSEQRPRALRIGLTGPIGCGKSTVATWLAEDGAAVIDADRLAREVIEPGTRGFDAVVEAFGPMVMTVDGGLDRTALGRIVFADPDALRRLEAIVHPDVRPLILDAMAAAETAGAPIVVLEAIGVVDGGYADLLDEIWLITCGRAEQEARLAERGLPPDVAAQRMAAQVELVERASRAATRSIDTSGDRGASRRRVEAALAQALGAGRATRARGIQPR
jgi:dephospho-CoA kinase